MQNTPLALVECALVAIIFAVIRLLEQQSFRSRYGVVGGRVWAIAPRFMLSNAQKPAGTNRLNPAVRRWTRLRNSEKREIRCAAEADIRHVPSAVHHWCAMRLSRSESYGADFSNLPGNQYARLVH